MEVYAVAFGEEYIIYRPLRRLAFIGNASMVRYIRGRVDGDGAPMGGEVDAFLDAVAFWEPDPPGPEPWQPTGEHRPSAAVLLLTTTCNLRCTYCYARGGEGPVQRLPTELARKAIDTAHDNAQADARGQFSLTLHGGGEPTTHWDALTAAVAHARSKTLPCETSMSTNGMWTQSQSEFIVEHFDHLSISFDGVREVQDAQRPRPDGAGSFDAVMGTMRALDEHDKSYGVRMTATPSSFSALPAGVELLCAETRCDGIQVEPCYATERGEYADPSPQDARAFVEAFVEAFEVASRMKRTLTYSGARPWVLASSFCRAPENSLVVTPEGDLVTCFETYSRSHPLTSQFVIGRLTPDRVEIDAEAVQAFAAVQNERRATCEGCFCYWHCGGDCASKCLSTPDPHRIRCQVNRDITRDLLTWYIAAGDGTWRGELAMQLAEPTGGTSDERAAEG